MQAAQINRYMMALNQVSGLISFAKGLPVLTLYQALTVSPNHPSQSWKRRSHLLRRKSRLGRKRFQWDQAVAYSSDNYPLDVSPLGSCGQIYAEEKRVPESQ